MQKPQTLGQYMVGDVLTRKEAILSWTGVAIMFFVVLVPTTNQTILAYFTKQVGPACCCALQTKLFSEVWCATLTHSRCLVFQKCAGSDDMQLKFPPSTFNRDRILPRLYALHSMSAECIA